jgi:hypothetical protein
LEIVNTFLFAAIATTGLKTQSVPAAKTKSLAQAQNIAESAAISL